MAKAELALLRGLHMFEFSQNYYQVGIVLSGMVPDENEWPIYWYLLRREA